MLELCSKNHCRDNANYIVKINAATVQLNPKIWDAYIRLSSKAFKRCHVTLLDLNLNNTRVYYLTALLFKMEYAVLKQTTVDQQHKLPEKQEIKQVME